MCIRKKLVKTAFDTWLARRYQAWAKNRALLGKIFEKANLRLFYLRYIMLERWETATWEFEEWEREEIYEEEYFTRTRRTVKTTNLTKKEMENIVINISEKSKHMSSDSETFLNSLKNANTGISNEGKLKLEMMLGLMSSINQARKNMPIQIITS